MKIKSIRYNISYCISTFVLLIMLFGSVSESNALNTNVYAKNSVLSAGKWVKVKITEDGIYKISASDISKWGFSNLANIRVYGYGGSPLSDVLSQDNYIDDLPQIPVLRTSSGILFYGKSQEKWNKLSSTSLIEYRQEQHPYSQYGCYFITENSEVPDLTYLTKGNPKGDEYPITSFTDRLYYEKELYSPGMTGRYLLGDDFKYSTTQTFKFDLKDIVPGHTVYVNTSFASKVMNGSSSVSYSYNGTAIQSSSEDIIRPVTDAAHEHVKVTSSVKMFVLDTPSLAYTIKFAYTGTLFVARLDYITINYTRALTLPASGSLSFRGSSNQDYSISGINDNTRILDISNSLSPNLLNVQLSGSNGVFRPDDSGEREFIAFNEKGNFPTPTFVENVTNQNIHSDEVPNMVIITPKEFKAQAKRIADIHESKDKMKVAVYVPEDIYNEFSSGVPDFNAYRHMLKMFWDRGNNSDDSPKLGYVLLFGRGSYDNRQITDKVKKASYPMLLTWQTSVGENENVSYNTDDLLSMMQDNSGKNMPFDKLDISVGRMPVKSEKEAKDAVDKLSSYINNTNKGKWKNNIMFISDDEDKSTHMIQAESAINNMKNNGGKNYLYTKLYQDAYTAVSAGAGRLYPEARSDMFSKFNEGVLWAHYIGHANPTGWTADGLLSLSDINNDMYYNNLPLLYTATCEFTRWDSDEISGGELMFLNSRGGAIALISTTRIAYISDNGVLGNYVCAQVFNKDKDGNYQRIGDILKNGKNTYTRSNDNKLRYSLVGDPAMRLNYPTYNISIDKINGVEVSSASQPSLEARSIVEVEGHIYDNSGNLATDYNGIITSKLYDAETSVETHGYGNGSNYVYQDRKKVLYLGQDSITDGAYKITFNMPSEITNNWSPALLSMYSYSEKGVEANGSTDNVYVYGYNEDAEVDITPPTINYFGINTQRFENGTSVNESPLVLAAFDDESGINLSNAGIGHQMTLLLDDKKTYDDVSNYYVPNKRTGGYIQYPLTNLNEGLHTLRLKVWDNANNSQDSTLVFNVVKGLAPTVVDVYSTANPAVTETQFYASHNQPDALISFSVEVYDLNGRLIWNGSETGKSNSNVTFPITWNLTDNAGRRVNRGIYIYRATISADGVQHNSKSKKIAVAAQ